MDAPRRWQVASMATAVASLGVGAALLARPAIETVPSIDLDVVETTAAPRVDARNSDATSGPRPTTPRIVLPPTPDEPGSIATSGSVDSPDSEPTGSGNEVPEDQPAPAPAVQDPPDAPTPPPAVRDPSVSPQSPASVDSPSSLDT